MEKYDDYLETRIADKSENQKEWLKGVIQNIIVHPNFGLDRNRNQIQIGHKFEFLFNMPVVKDKLVYNEENNKNKRYFIKDCRKN